ncbi:MAG: hypothetical protein JWM21_2543 [Acidobacteria bacterium]|nr:hypothetical protein [Acidobacteriota bacterium]
MALSNQLKEFTRRWRAKARPHGEQSLRQSFDRFFTLYVVFNSLYAEATLCLARQGCVKIENRNHFPDAEAAQEYVVQYLGARHLLQELNNDSGTRAALESIKALVCGGTFFFKLNMLTGAGQPDEDADLYCRLTSTNKNAQACAILEILYSIRCNMFHGRKGFNEIQKDLLGPVNTILERIIEILYVKLDSANPPEPGAHGDL